MILNLFVPLFLFPEQVRKPDSAGGERNGNQVTAFALCVGGGSIAFEREILEKPPRVYALDSFAAIAARQ